MIISAFIKANAQEIVWTRQSQDVAFLEGCLPSRMETDNQGNVIALYHLMGRTRFEGELVQSQGINEILLIKYNGDGFIIWKKMMGGSNWDVGADLAIDSENNILVTGTIIGGGDFLGTKLLKDDGEVFAAKIDPQGDLIWIKQIKGFAAIGNSITDDKHNNVIVGTRLSSTELKLAKYTPSSTLIWEKIILQNTCCLNPEITNIIVDPNNRIIVTGNFFLRLQVDSHIIGTSNTPGVFIFCLTEAGTYVWSTVVDATQDVLDEAKSSEIDVDEAGNLYLAGTFEDRAKFGSIILNEKNELDDRTGFITKIDTQGNFVWAYSLYGSDVGSGGIKINRNTHELSLCVASHTFFEYADQYISTIKANQSMILTLDLNGQFRRAYFLSEGWYGCSPSDIEFLPSNEFYVIGGLGADCTVGCFNLDGGSLYTSFLLKNGKIPDIEIKSANGFCLKEAIRLQLSGPNIDRASKFEWFFPPGVNPVNGSNQTTVKYIDVTIEDNFKESPFTIVPYYECYPRTEFSSKLYGLIAAPAVPSLPQGDTILCIAKKLPFISNPVERADTYEWVLSPNLQGDNSLNNFTFLSTSVSDQIGFVQVRASNRCGKSELSNSLKVWLNPKPSKPLVNGVLEVCAGQSNVNFSATGKDNTLTYGWKYPTQLRMDKSNPDSSAVTFTFPQNLSSLTIYSLAKGHCDVVLSDPVNINIVPLLPALSIISGATEICKNTNNIPFSVEPINQAVTYYWTYPRGFTQSLDNGNAVVLETKEDALSGAIQVYISNKCFTSEPKTMAITVLSMPQKPEIVLGDCHKFIQYRGTENHSWFRDNDLLNTNTDQLQLLDSGYYKLKAFNACGESESDVVAAYPVIQERLSLPNVITPNDDNLNTYFVVDPSLKGSSIEIFNRWGQSVYQSYKYNNDWDGGPLSNGVYYYILSNSCLTNSIKGVIHLMR